jgi:hypothetical protein
MHWKNFHMAEARVERRLAAILAGEVIDYSRLVEDDEADTLAVRRSRHRNVLEPIIARHQGRISSLPSTACWSNSIMQSMPFSVQWRFSKPW